MASITEIPGLMDSGHNEAYQSRVRNAVWKAILETVQDPVTKQAYLRNEDTIEALLSLQAMMLATAKDADTPTKLRKWGEEFGKRLRKMTAEFQRSNADGESVFDTVINLDERQ